MEIRNTAVILDVCSYFNCVIFFFSFVGLVFNSSGKDSNFLLSLEQEEIQRNVVNCSASL